MRTEAVTELLPNAEDMDVHVPHGLGAGRVSWALCAPHGRGWPVTRGPKPASFPHIPQPPERWTWQSMPDSVHGAAPMVNVRHEAGGTA